MQLIVFLSGKPACKIQSIKIVQAFNGLKHKRKGKDRGLICCIFLAFRTRENMAIIKMNKPKDRVAQLRNFQPLKYTPLKPAIWYSKAY